MSNNKAELEEQVRDAIRVAEQMYFNRLIGSGCPGLTIEMKVSEFYGKVSELFEALWKWCVDNGGEVNDGELNVQAYAELTRLLGNP